MEPSIIPPNMLATAVTTVRGFLTQWTDLHNLGRKPRTQAFHGEVLRLLLKTTPKLDSPPQSVTVQDILAVARELEHYCPSRWNLAVTMLQALTPAAACLKRRPPRFRHKSPPTAAEFSRLVSALEKRPRSKAALVVRFLAHTGLRIGEARKLKWSDVKADCLLLPAEVTKNARPRPVPFVPGLTSVLQALREAGTGEHVLPQAECKRSLATACARAGVPLMSHHDFRHLFATRCIESGVDLPTVSRWLGHLDGGALLGRMYFHLLDGHSRKMAAQVKV